MALTAKQKKYLIIVVVIVGLVLGYIAWQQTQQDTYFEQEVQWDRVDYELMGKRSGDTVRLKATLDDKPIDLFANDVVMHATIVSEALTDLSHFVLTDNLREVRKGVYEFEYPMRDDRTYHLWLETNNISTRDHHGEKSDFAAFVKIPAIFESDAVEPLANDSSRAGNFTMNLTKNTLAPSRAGRLTVELTRDGGPPEALKEDFDHFYTLVSHEHEFYTTAHVDQELLAENNLETSTLSIEVPGPGKYSFWMAAFPKEEIDRGIFLQVEGQFIVAID